MVKRQRRKQNKIIKCCAALQNGERGTVKPKSGFDAKDDAVALRKAIEGLGKKHTQTRAFF